MSYSGNGQWHMGEQHYRNAARIAKRAFLAEQKRKQERLKRQARQRRENPMDETLERVEALAKKARSVVASAASQEQKLYDAELGVSRYDYDKHRALLAQIRETRNNALNEIRAEAKRISAENRRQVDLLQDFDKSSILSGPELSEVNARMPLVRSQFEGASPPQIARRLESIGAHGSKVERYCAWLAAKERASELEERGHDFARIGFAKEYSDLDIGLFRDEWSKRTAPYVSAVNSAEELVTFCYTRMKDATSIATAHTTYSIDEHIQRQKYERGGRPLEPSALDNEGREPAGGEVA